VADSTWEAQAAFELDRNEHVAAWVKNDHVGFEVTYIHDGTFHKFRPDYLIRFANGAMLIVEVKGQDTDKDRAKRAYLAEWIGAVNTHGGFGTWRAGVVLEPADLQAVIQSAGVEMEPQAR
jgi:type III restriction enzyme